MGRRLALLIATYDYQDSGLRQLTAPAHDAEALAAVLRDPDIAGFEVTALINQPHHVVGEAIGDFYRDRRRDDLTLLYFTGHGLKDDGGRLHLAMSNTRRDSLLFTGLSAEQIDQAMEGCVSRQKVLILDCCYSGAFPAGRLAKADTSVHALERFQGRGRTVLTASDATQYSFEGKTPLGQAAQSVFTRYLVEGLRDGSADLDGDGDITLDELYGYVHDRVVDEMPQQRPKKLDSVEGRIVVARNINWVLPAHLRNAIGSPIATDRLGALDGLAHLHRIGNAVVRGAVLDEIRRLASDDSKLVSAAAAARMPSLLPQPPEQTPEPLVERPAGPTPPEPRKVVETPPATEVREVTETPPASPTAQPQPPRRSVAASHPPTAAPGASIRPHLDGPSSTRLGAPVAGTARGSRFFPRIRRARALTAGVALLVLATTVVVALLTTRGEGESSSSASPAPIGLLTGAGQFLNYSPDGKTLATVGDRRVRLWDLSTPFRKEIATLNEQTIPNTGVVFSPDGHTVVTTELPPSGQLTDNVSVRLRNVSTGKTTTIRTGHKLAASAAFSPDGKTLATAADSGVREESFDNPIRLWDVATGKKTATLAGHTNLIGTMEFSPDGKTLVTGSNDDTVRLWNLETGKATILRGPYVAALSLDGKTLATSGGKYSPVQLRNAAAGKVTAVLTSAKWPARFSRDGKTLATGGDDSTVRVWNTVTGKAVTTVSGTGLQVELSPDGKTLVTDLPDGETVRVWNATNGKTIAGLPSLPSRVRSAAFSPDGKTLATASEDGTVRLWRVSDFA
ncbi:caspase family protein [Streptomyces sp. NPDC056464]|uniref:caspase, EACC1-associated type n=1 Tax=Streptomyces sp. NPDC056464 TaxID=3345828 RepID=UPI003682C783